MNGAPASSTFPIVSSKMPRSDVFASSGRPILSIYSPKLSSPSSSATRLPLEKSRYSIFCSSSLNIFRTGRIAPGLRNPNVQNDDRFRKKLPKPTDWPGIVLTQRPFLNQAKFITERIRGKFNSSHRRAETSQDLVKKSAPSSMQKPSTRSPPRRPPTLSLASSRTKSMSCFLRAHAALRPADPPPIMTTFSVCVIVQSFSWHGYNRVKM